MIVHTNSFKYLWEVLELEEYSFLFKDLDVMDLGCGIGSFSLWIYPFSSKIYAIDMDEQCVNLFRKTVKDTKLDKIEIFKERMGGKNTIKTFMDGHSIKHIDVLKMDIEGDELEVLESADFPADRINTIIGEQHYSDSRLESFITRLSSLGYRYTNIPGGHFVARK